MPLIPSFKILFPRYRKPPYASNSTVSAWVINASSHIIREIACDASVLNMLDENDYEEYGNTLISFAEKISRMPFPFATGFFTGKPGRNMEQMKRRIINIASYEKPTSRQTRKGVIAFTLTAVLLVGLAPSVPTYAADITL